MLKIKQAFKIKFGNFFRKKPKKIDYSVKKLKKVFHSVHLGREVEVDCYYPSSSLQRNNEGLSLLILNDGQDMEAIQLEQHLKEYYKEKPLLAVAIHAGDRLQEYGTSKQLDYANRGQQSTAYAKFITKELLPFIHTNFSISTTPQDHTIAGFSLGGLSAFDLAWQHPDFFGKVGVFSGSFWWRSKAFRAEDPDADRIVHTMVENDKISPRQHLRFWLQTGTKDEEDDRNNNGVIDAIDDTLDLIKALEQKGIPSSQIHYVEVEDGTHTTQTWGEIFPDFLRWIGHNH